MAFLFPNTSTENVDFRNLMDGSDEWPTEAITELNTLRQYMVEVLTSQPGTVGSLASIDAYYPYVERLAKTFHPSDQSKKQFKFKWRAVLMPGIRTSISSGATEKPFVKCESLYYELLYVLLAYSFTLYNMATSRVGSNPQSTSESAKNEAIDLYCKASGVLTYAATNIAPSWMSPEQDAPPETTLSMLTALAELALADAQLVAIAKADAKGLSAATILRLYSWVSSKYSSCSDIVKRCTKDLAIPFRSYVEDGARYHLASFYHRFAKVCFESTDDPKNGLAVSAIGLSRNILADLHKSESPRIRTLVKGDFELVCQLQERYAKINNNVAYQRVPNETETRASLPAGVSVVAAKPYIPMVRESLGKKGAFKDSILASDTTEAE